MSENRRDRLKNAGKVFLEILPGLACILLVGGLLFLARSGPLAPYDITGKMLPITIPSGTALGSGYMTANRNAQDGKTEAEDVAFFASAGKARGTNGAAMVLVRKEDVAEGLAEAGAGLDVRARKRLFIQAVMPAAVAAVHEVRETHCAAASMRRIIENGEMIGKRENAEFRALAAKYGLHIRHGLAERTDMLDAARALEASIDVVPPSFLVAMAAHDTEWGMKPSAISQGALFKTSPVALDGGSAYSPITTQLVQKMERLNRWQEFSHLRNERGKARKDGLALSSALMAGSLAHTNIYGVRDAVLIAAIIDENGLADFDNARFVTPDGPAPSPAGKDWPSCRNGKNSLSF